MWILVAVCACGRIGFDPFSGGVDPTGDGGGTDGQGPPDPDGSIDSSVDASTIISQTTCTPPGNACSFPGGLPCSCWGTPMMVNAGLSESAGTLTVTPNADTIGAQGSCLRSATPFPAAGAIVEISSVVSGAQGLTAIQIGGSPDVYQLAVYNGNLIAEDGSGTLITTPYAAVPMRWWRIRPSGGGVIFETSPDGRTWTTLTTSARAPSTSYAVRLIGGTIGGQAAPGSAKFESVNDCPP